MRVNKEAPRFTEDEENALRKRMLAGDNYAANLLAESMRPWSLRLAGKYFGKGIDVEELESLAFCGIADALRKWNSCRGRLITVTTWYVRRRLQRAVLEERTAIHVPQYVFRKDQLGSKCREEGDLASTMLSLDYDFESDGGLVTSPAKEIPDNHDYASVVEDVEYRQYQRSLVLSAITKLKPRWRQALELRLSGMTLRQVGDVMGCTRERIRQLEQKAIKFIRDEIYLIH